MILAIQKVSHAKVAVQHNTIAQIQSGLLVLVCAEQDDDPLQVDFPTAHKLIKLRIFPDQEHKMNLALKDQPTPELLLVPQFTLAADCRKGNRPSFTKAARPEVGLKLFNRFKSQCEQLLGCAVPQGEFGAHMQVTLCNDGPTTIILRDQDLVN